jgi:hypothetical protein
MLALPQAVFALLVLQQPIKWHPHASPHRTHAVLLIAQGADGPNLHRVTTAREDVITAVTEADGVTVSEPYDDNDVDEASSDIVVAAAALAGMAALGVDLMALNGELGLFGVAAISAAAAANVDENSQVGQTIRAIGGVASTLFNATTRSSPPTAAAVMMSAAAPAVEVEVAQSADKARAAKGVAHAAVGAVSAAGIESIKSALDEVGARSAWLISQQEAAAKTLERMESAAKAEEAAARRARELEAQWRQVARP